MKKLFYTLILFLIGIIISCSEDKVDIIGYGTITGRVVEQSSFEPIENAKVAISPTNNTVFTDEEGYFLMDGVEVGDYSVSATKEDYLTKFVPVTVSLDSEVNVILEMDDDDALNKPPSTPILHSPSDGSEDLDLSVQLIWSSDDPDNDELTYRIEIKNDVDNEVIEIEEVIDTSYVVSTLKYGVKYFWQIAANDDINPEVLSLVSSFKTKKNPENRYLYVQNVSNGNSVIYSSSFNETISDDPEADIDELNNKVQLTDEDKNSWRPRKNQASSLIAFLRTVNNEAHIFTMNQDGSNVKQVTSSIPVDGYNMNEVKFSWSSNGEKLIYPSYNKLYRINKDGSGLEQIYETVDGSFITECEWSYDGTIIALKTNNISGYNVSIFTIDMQGNVIKTVLSGVTGAANGLDLSVDNKFLLYAYDVSGYEDVSYRQLDSRIFTYNLETDDLNNVSNDKEVGFNDFDARFSPNEAEVIFVNTSNDGISENSIFRVAVVGGNRSKLFDDCIMPDWE